MNDIIATAAMLLAWIAFMLVVTTRAERATGSMPRRASLALAGGCAIVAGSLALARGEAASLACALSTSGLVVAGFADARTGYLYDAATFPAAIATALAAVIAGESHAAALGVAALVLGFGGVFVVSRGELMGLGDVKAMYALGAAFGPAEALVAIFGACVCGIAYALLAKRYGRGRAVAFGPHLAVGCLFAIVAGKPIVLGVLGS